MVVRLAPINENAGRPALRDRVSVRDGEERERPLHGQIACRARPAPYGLSARRQHATWYSGRLGSAPRLASPDVTHKFDVSYRAPGTNDCYLPPSPTSLET